MNPINPWTAANAGTVYYTPTITTGITGTTTNTFVLQPVAAVPAPPKVEPDDELTWLRRRVSEITELVAA